MNVIECPHCEHAITPEELKTLWGRWRASMAAPHAGPGRPRWKKRCACGEMTVNTAKRRNHKCVAPAPKARKVA